MTLLNKKYNIINKTITYLLVILLISSIFYSDWSNLWENQPASLNILEAHAAQAGQMAIYTDSNGTFDTNVTSYTGTPFNNQARQDSIYTQNANDIDIDLGEDGHYLFGYNIRARNDTYNNRMSWHTRVTLGGATQIFGHGQGVRRNSANDQYAAYGFGIVNATSGDDIRTEILRDSTLSSAHNLVADRSAFWLLKLDDAWEYLRLQGADNQSTQTTVQNINFTSQLENTDYGSTTYEHSTATNPEQITLKQTGHYLITYNIGMDGATSRTSASSRLTVNGVPVEQSHDYTYFRNSDGMTEGTVTNMSIVNVTSSDSILRLQWAASGAVSAYGTQTISGQTGITIVKLNDSADYLRSHKSNSLQNINGTAVTVITHDVQDEADSGSFSYNTGTGVTTIQQNGNYLFTAGMRTNRSSTGSTRLSRGGYWYVNGTRQTVANTAVYVRGNQGTPDTYDGGWSSAGLFELSNLDTVDFRYEDEGDNGNGTDYIQANSEGITAVNIDTLFVSGYEQSAYRWYENSDSTAVGSNTLASLNTAATAPEQGTPFRLRMLMHITSSTLDVGTQSFKLQFAQRSGTCDTGFSGETYADVATASGAIQFYDNSTPTDGSLLTTTSTDPTHGSDNVVAQTYEESNNFSVTSTIPMNDDGLWDFSLVDNSAPATTAYCFRIVKSDNSLLDTYTVIPQITTAAPTVASDGQVAIYGDSNGTFDTNVTANTGTPFNNQIRQDTIYTQNANDIDVDLGDDGHYLFGYVVNARNDTYGNRMSWHTRVTLAGSEQVNGHGQGYRRSAADDLYAAYGFGIINATSGDDLRVEIRRDSTYSAAHNTIANRSSFWLLKLKDDWEYLRLQGADNQATQSTLQNINFTTQLENTDSGSTTYTHSTATNPDQITLKQTGHYLITYNVGLDGATGRTSATTRLTINGVPVEQSYDYTYIRASNGTGQGTATNMSIVNVTSSDSILRVQWGAVGASGAFSTDTIATQTGISIVKLNDGADYLRVHKNNSTQNLNSTSITTITHDAADEVDSGSFSYSTTTGVATIGQTDDYLFTSGMRSNRGTSGTARLTRGGYWYINGVRHSVGNTGVYVRGDQGTQDTFDGGWSGGGLLELLDTDTVDFRYEDEGSNGNGADNIQADSEGITAVNIDSLFTGIVIEPMLEMSGYGWYENNDSTGVSVALAATNTPAQFTTSSQVVRLRMLLHVATSTLTQSTESYKLQYAERSGTCDAGFSGESYVDVSATTPIKFYDNSTTTDGATVTLNSTLDPLHSGHSVIAQTYNETNIFTNSVADIDVGEDGLWDFVLQDNNATSGLTYCFRAVKSDNSLLDTYTFLPELSTLTAYSTNGTYISNSFDTGAPSNFNIISWVESFSGSCASCTVRLQIQTAPDSGGSPGAWSATWCGPDGEDGDSTDFFTVADGSLIHTDHNGDQWIRYLATFTGSGNGTPVLEEVLVNYKNIP